MDSIHPLVRNKEEIVSTKNQDENDGTLFLPQQLKIYVYC